MLETFRTGAWLNRQRLQIYPLILLTAFIIAGVGLAVTAHRGIDAYGRPLGSDFSEIWVAGRAVDQGDPARPYDVAAYQRDQINVFGVKDGFYIWPYPPFFLAIAAVLALWPYGVAFAIWQSTTLGLYLATIFAVLRPARLPATPVLVTTLAFPPAFINFMHGQNGFLTAGLLGGGLVLLPKKPLAAGLCFALLAYKPHLGLLVVPALVAGGQWRTLVSGALALTAMALASLAAFGTAPWHGFFDHLALSRTLLELGATGFGKFISPFAAIRLGGGGVTLSYGIQAFMTAAMLLAVVYAWRSRADLRLKAAVLIAANLAATPYAFDYDLVALGPALAFALSYGLDKGFRGYEKSFLALIWIAPILIRPLASTFFIPLGPPVILVFVAGLMFRAWTDTGSSKLLVTNA